MSFRTNTRSRASSPAILPESIVSTLGHSTDLSFVPLEGDHEYVDILAIWKDNTSNPVTHVFKDFVLKEYGVEE